MSDKRNISIIGGGLVGALCACYMSKRNFKVCLYEKRPDMREIILERGKSINLSLSSRGRRALRHVGLEEEVLKDAVPMKGRLVHDQYGGTKYIHYDVKNNECLYSISRNNLNRIILTAAELQPNVKLFFNHELVAANFEDGTIQVMDLETHKTFRKENDFIIGADGAHSSVRKEMQKQNLFSFSQKYIEHGYMELQINAAVGAQMIPNCLHLWPRGDFMMIALPNADQSWTVTLFMPYVNFDTLQTPENVVAFFKNTFPDAVPFLGEDHLKQSFSDMRPRSLISVSCEPYHMGDRTLLIGDAAHAMVPFYGQGMNAGFEDCFLLNEILENSKDNIALTVAEFSRNRTNDGFSICQLAMYNYRELRELVTKGSYHMRKKLDEFLYFLIPGVWIPLYTSVTFTNMRYQSCLRNKEWQDKIITRGLTALAFFLLSPGLFYALRA